MMTQYSTDTMIDEMVATRFGSTVSARQKHLYREALRALARQAKAEQLHAMRSDVRILTGDPLPDLHHFGETE
jgi:hypothetical protein